MVVAMPVSARPARAGSYFLPGHFRAVLIVRMAVRGIERLPERNTPLSGKPQSISAAGHHLIAGQQPF